MTELVGWTNPLSNSSINYISQNVLFIIISSISISIIIINNNNNKYAVFIY